MSTDFSAKYYRIHPFLIAPDESSIHIEERIIEHLGVTASQLLEWQIVRQAIDARKRRNLQLVCTIECLLESTVQPVGAALLARSALDIPRPVELPTGAQRRGHAIIVGAGPAGLFAALALAEGGLRVTLLERGQAVEQRMRDIGRLRSRGELNPESNICFGEGGAGTYTDGKLYTRIKHPFVRWVLQRMVDFGADADILVQAHPHLGTDRLVRLVRQLRQHLLSLGVDYRFGCRVESVLHHQGDACGVELASGEQISADHVVLAIGHSARDTFARMQQQGIAMEAKDFAVGVRVEHPQDWVNQQQHGAHAGHALLGAAEYRLSHQVDDQYLGQRGVYSFCMCPGGLILPSATEHEHMAINGMSNAKRSSPFANSGIVVQVSVADLQRYRGHGDALSGIRFQRELEHQCYTMCSQPYAAPAMRISDFIQRKASGTLANTRFKPSVEAADLNTLLPHWLAEPLRQGMLCFHQKMHGFVSKDANMLAIESRTSSPIRLNRDEQIQSLSMRRLYPVGEGAGYAGGIVSAAVDGLKAASVILSTS